ncbi:MAG: helix-turn-helix transcriptional regulator [Cyanobacteria bacterium J06633_2]
MALEMHCQLAVLMAQQRPKLTQRVLSEATGLSTHTISQLVQDKVKRIDYGTATKLCAYFGCTLDGLYSLEEVEN